MYKKTAIFLTTLLFVFILCGAASAATVKANHNTVSNIKVGTVNYDQDHASIDGTRVVLEQTNSSGSTAIYYKNLATGSSSKVLSSKQNQ